MAIEQTMNHPTTGTELSPTVVSKTFVQNGVQINITDVPATEANGDLFYSDEVAEVFFNILDLVESRAIPGVQRIDLSYEAFIRGQDVTLES